ncbi:hypothetical protein Sjap_016836 [Stephania japonica]|uniref:Protein kinase domain-containing protein n=1 Tax=Stephania japonica TaxID=461633 RepID=A0AAP0NLA3_9MAGN
METHIVSAMKSLNKASSSIASSPSSPPDHKARNLFQWGGTVSAIWVIHELHDSIVGVILCILIGVILFIDNIKGSGRFVDRSRFDLCCFFYWPQLIIFPSTGKSQMDSARMGKPYKILTLLVILCLSTSDVSAQQEYSGNSVLDCGNIKGGSSSAYLYACNGEKPTCKTFLIFKSLPPYNSVTTISELTSADPLEFARINNVSRNATFPTYKEVIVPVTCSCSGQYYQANSSFVTRTRSDTYFSIANDIYQGLSTCDSLMGENPYRATELLPGFKLRVPLRCACPTSNQTAAGTKYLLTYSICWNDNVTVVSERFNASDETTLLANKFSEAEPTIFPFTTILIPLATEPSSSQTIVHPPPNFSPPVTVPVFTVNRSSNGKAKTKIYVGAAVGVAASFLLVSSVALACRFMNCRRSLDSSKSGKNIVLPEDLLVTIASIDRVLEVFEAKELKVATNNFSNDFKIKGSVYCGVINQKRVAIKKMSTDASKEVNMLNKINHFNLIKLYGVCKDESYAYLVYEYMENGSLKNWLRNKNSSGFQSWAQRIQIAVDVANGLHYLHKFADPAYIHKDIKSSNILLDRELRAKIANFDLVSLAEKKISTKFLGTRGYMAPEYLEVGLVTPKMDVYAFGVVMLELITGKEAVMVQDGREVLLSTALIHIMEKVNPLVELSEFIDPTLKVLRRMDITFAMAKLCDACLTRDPTLRLNMEKVVSVLVRIHSRLSNE